MQEIFDWLEKLGLGDYARNFVENDIAFGILIDLTDQDLEKIGIKSLGHRRRILRAIAELGDGGKTAQKTTASSEAISTSIARDTGERRQVMDSIVIGGDLSAIAVPKNGDRPRRLPSRIKWLWLGNGKIGGMLRLDEAEVGERPDGSGFEARGLVVGSDLTMLTTTFVDVNLREARIAGNLDLSGAKQRDRKPDGSPATIGLAPLRFDLTGAAIGRAFILGSRWYGPVQWRPGGYLSLRNSTVRDIEDGIEDCGKEPKGPDVVCSDAWPSKLDLAAFDYQRLSSSDLSSRTDMASRGLTWWLGWLTRQDQFSPQPYDKLAAVLRAHGLPDTADEILVAEKQRERANSPLDRKLWLTIHWLLIDYGYHPFRALWWVLARPGNRRGRSVEGFWGG
jgi:hypothetical protein